MIQLKEIKVNNWFLHNSDWSAFNNTGEPKYIKWDDAHWYALGECTLSLENIIPIPLDEVILLKCGFVTSNIEFAGVKVSMEHKDGIYSVNLMNDGTYQFGLPYEDFCTDVKSLHQVQNLFYCLSGQELNVEL